MTTYIIKMTATVEADSLVEAVHIAQTTPDMDVTVTRKGADKAALVAKSWSEVHHKLLLRTKIEDMPWSTRTRNHFFSAGIRTLGDLIKWTPDQLLARRGFGQSCLDEINTMLEQTNLALSGTQGELPLQVKPAVENGREKMHPAIEKAFNEIDAAIFSGDTFFDADNLTELKRMLTRWQSQLPYFEEMAAVEDESDED